jgi:uncharacterized membrane protein SpoIIM required for sporulation
MYTVEIVVTGLMKAGNGKRQEWVVNSSIVLISAVFASLAAGVLLAYGICMAMFGIFRIHARQVAEKSAQSVVAQVVEG